METSRRFGTLALVLALAWVLGACTGGDEAGGPTGGSGPTAATGDDGGPVPVETVTGPPGTGTYEYANAGLQVTMEIDGNQGTLQIRNGTGRGLPKPSFYILDARDGRQVDGRVSGSAPVPDGEDASFDISFDGIEVRNIGLVVLLLGKDNYGAFVRTG